MLRASTIGWVLWTISFIAIPINSKIWAISLIGAMILWNIEKENISPMKYSLGITFALAVGVII